MNYEKNKESYKKYYQDHKEYILERMKKYNEKNKEYLTKYKKGWYEANKKRISKRKKEWSLTERGKASRQRIDTKRRTKIEGVLNTLTAGDWQDILKKHNFKCVYCGKDLLTLFGKPEKDHVIPISKGGNNTKDNIVPSCRGCNARKGSNIYPDTL